MLAIRRWMKAKQAGQKMGKLSCSRGTSMMYRSFSRRFINFYATVRTFYKSAATFPRVWFLINADKEISSREKLFVPASWNPNKHLAYRDRTTRGLSNRRYAARKLRVCIALLNLAAVDHFPSFVPLSNETLIICELHSKLRLNACFSPDATRNDVEYLLG